MFVKNHWYHCVLSRQGAFILVLVEMIKVMDDELIETIMA